MKEKSPIILFRSNFVALNQNKNVYRYLSGIHKCGKQDNVNTGIQLAFGSPFPVFRQYLLRYIFYTLSLTYRAFYSNTLKSTVCYTTAPLATNCWLSAKRKPFSARQSSSQPKESLRVNIVSYKNELYLSEYMPSFIWR